MSTIEVNVSFKRLDESKFYVELKLKRLRGENILKHTSMEYSNTLKLFYYVHFVDSTTELFTINNNVLSDIEKSRKIVTFFSKCIDNQFNYFLT